MTDKEKGSCSVNICRDSEPETLHPAVLIWLSLGQNWTTSSGASASDSRCHRGGGGTRAVAQSSVESEAEWWRVRRYMRKQAEMGKNERQGLANKFWNKKLRISEPVFGPNSGPMLWGVLALQLLAKILSFYWWGALSALQVEGWVSSSLKQK